jgi:hypothetical protein
MSVSHFPAVGHVYEANFGSWVFHLHFHSETEMTLTNVQGSFKGVFETVQITVTPIRRSIFLICWPQASFLYSCMIPTTALVGRRSCGLLHCYANFSNLHFYYDIL